MYFQSAHLLPVLLDRSVIVALLCDFSMDNRPHNTTTYVTYGNIEGYNMHAYSHMDSISYTIPA
jgi:hypothetical protein